MAPRLPQDAEQETLEPLRSVTMQILDTALTPVLPANVQRAQTPQAQAGAPTFAETLGTALDTVNLKNQEANTAVTQMLDGTSDVHDTMIALHEAEEAIELTVAVRNKLVRAYQDIMSMPV